MRVLNVEYRIVPRLLSDFGEVKIERRLILAVEHHEADDIRPDLVHHLAQGDKLTRALRHAHRFAIAEELHQLTESDDNLNSTFTGKCRCDRLKPLDVSTVIGAENI